MANPLHAALGAAQTVTASALVRQFGLWQDRAVRAPVYILHRGRPRLALTSVDLLEALCAPQPGDAGRRTALDAMLDASSEIVAIIDADLFVTHLNTVARDYFGAEASRLLPLDRFFRRPAADLLVETVRRVIARGTSETIGIAAPRGAGRRLSVTVKPWRDGAALFARDITVEEDLRHAQDQVRALDQALATGSAAAARIDLRGRLASPTPSLAALTGITAEALAGSRFVALFEPDMHAALAAAIEAVIADGVPRSISAVRLIDRARSPIRIGFSPSRRGAVPDGVAAILIGD